MTLSEEELKQRQSAIANGPWAAHLAEAGAHLEPPEKLRITAAGASPIALDKLRLSAPNQQKNEELATILRSHFEDPNGITDPTEIKVRFSLDQALMLPQLYELAIQTGYLPAEHVAEPARKLLTDLLWSPAARKFITAYDYLGVSMLATRVGITGVGSAHPPEAKAGGALYFAGFLAHLRAFYADEQIQTWIDFLDDYAYPNEARELWEYLHELRETAPRRTPELLTGCQLFVTSLASVFQTLDESDLGHFGLIHAYWLQKFFGYENDGSDYVKDTDHWDPNDSWAETIATSPRTIDASIDRDIAEVFRKQFREQLELLNRTFDAVKSVAHPKT